MQEPIVVKSFGDEQYLGCTGFPADTHVVKWLTCSRDRPIERCPECGSVYQMEYVGPQDVHHDAHGHSAHDTRKSFDILEWGRKEGVLTDFVTIQTPTPTALTTTRASQRPLPTSSGQSTDKGAGTMCSV